MNNGGGFKKSFKFPEIVVEEPSQENSRTKHET